MSKELAVVSRINLFLFSQINLRLRLDDLPV